PRLGLRQESSSNALIGTSGRLALIFLASSSYPRYPENLRKASYHSEQDKKGNKPPEENLLLGMKPASLFIRIVPARKRMHP
ncbi:MAG: hypothetical protein WBD75_06595, partial [Phycisphaerae bacterium]